MRNTTTVRSLLTALLLVTVSLLFAGAQSPPDLTGTWKQNNKLSTPLGTSDRIRTETIEHADTGLKVRIVTVGRPDTFIEERTYATDGRRHSSSTGSGERTTTAQWENATLVIETVDHAKSGSVTITRETWVLSRDGRTLRKSIRTRGPDGETHALIVLDRQ